MSELYSTTFELYEAGALTTQLFRLPYDLEIDLGTRDKGHKRTEDKRRVFDLATFLSMFTIWLLYLGVNCRPTKQSAIEGLG